MRTMKVDKGERKAYLDHLEKAKKANINIPYQKIYDRNGNLINPIGSEGYPSLGPNRQQRKKNLVQPRVVSNKKGAGLIVVKHGHSFTKVKRFVQSVKYVVQSGLKTIARSGKTVKHTIEY